MENSLVSVANKLEIALSPLETCKTYSREEMESLCETNKNQHDTWRFTAQSGLLHAAKHNGEECFLIVQIWIYSQKSHTAVQKMLQPLLFSFVN